MRYTSDSLLIRPHPRPDDPGLLLHISPELAGWSYISFQVRRLEHGERWSSATGDRELAIVDLGGRYTVASSRGRWEGIGSRESVFTGAGHVLYLPPGTEFAISAERAGEFAVASAPAVEQHAPLLIRPADVPIYVRGGGNASRQINDLLPPGSPVQRLVLVEVYTPGGNWSSYPPHKHDVHAEDGQGNLLEADLEEVYYYRFDRPEGYAFQRIYTGETSPLHMEGRGFDATVCPTDGCAVLVPEGYHPVASPPGYTTYYLNVLAGSAQSLANRDDPRYSWVKETYGPPDPRLPLY